MIELEKLRARIAELERYYMGNAPAPVRARSEFDLQALKLLLEKLEKGE